MANAIGYPSANAPLREVPAYASGQGQARMEEEICAAANFGRPDRLIRAGAATHADRGSFRSQVRSAPLNAGGKRAAVGTARVCLALYNKLRVGHPRFVLIDRGRPKVAQHHASLGHKLFLG